MIITAKQNNDAFPIITWSTHISLLCYKTEKIIICDPTPANEALCGKINSELWAKMSSKVKISQKFKYA